MTVGQDITPLKEAGASLNENVAQEHHDDLVTEVQRILKMEDDMRKIVSEVDPEDIFSLMLSKSLVFAIMEQQARQFGVLADLVGFTLTPVPDVTVSIANAEAAIAGDVSQED